MTLAERASVHAALGDGRRLGVVDRLTLGDLTVAELAALTGMKGNLLAHHLDVLEDAGLIERRVSEGDQRRRYVSLRWDRLPERYVPTVPGKGRVVFVCTHNSARSQFAAALWGVRTGHPASSAGSDPTAEVHPKAVRVAGEYGIDLSGETPGGYDRLPSGVGLVVSVCDRARESGVPDGNAHLHWSVRDPVPAGTVGAFRDAFAEIAVRIENLARGSAA
jgi:ArsR family transcriptional regulator, arsenate/arsenite/antimonite-responsive transcriptional repressor / arsenate reductase (thioredoxin)